MSSDLANRLHLVQEKIRGAAISANRDPADIELVVVTKNHGYELPLELLELGINQFGENKDQEASAKAEEVSSRNQTGLRPTWHFVGQLQSNKVRSMLEYTSVLHSLDRQSLLKELAKQLVKEPSRTLDVFIELNLTDDPNRGGIAPINLLSFAKEVKAVSQLNLLGVMGVAGLGIDPKVDLARIKVASDDLRSFAPEARFISAGMSGDYEEAILMGATHLRIGTAITADR